MRVVGTEGLGIDICHSLVQGTVPGFGTDGCHTLFWHSNPGSRKDSCHSLFHHNIPTYICTDIQRILETRNSQNQTSGIIGFREGFPHKNFLNINFIYIYFISGSYCGYHKDWRCFLGCDTTKSSTDVSTGTCSFHHDRSTLTMEAAGSS